MEPELLKNISVFRPWFSKLLKVMHTTKPVSHPTDLGRNSQELTQCTSQLVPELGPWSLALTYKDSWKRHENLPGGKSWRIPLSRCDSALLFAFIFAFISVWWGCRWGSSSPAPEQGPAATPSSPAGRVGSQLAANWEDGNFTITGGTGSQLAALWVTHRQTIDTQRWGCCHWCP